MALAITSFGQDTTAYSLQRKKINHLLDKRSATFGQYNESLNMRTGIFGLQTKRDIKNSNEILRQAVLTDNNIFKELKILLDYKDLQVQQVKSVATDNASTITSYKTAIRNLQEQNRALAADLEKNQQNSDLLKVAILVLTILIALLIFYMLKYKNTMQHEKKPV